MIQMSFYNGTLNRDAALEAIIKTHKPIMYSCSIGVYNPNRHRDVITKEKAMDIICKPYNLLDVMEHEDFLLINEFSTDVWRVNV